jgi:tetratricopeptide (TPR) repeat protein
MLRSEEISNWIKDPSALMTEDLASLNELTEKYPYTHIFSILYLKGLSKSGNVQFDDELIKHSYRIPDRVQLYHLIQDHTDAKEIVLQKEAELPPKQNEDTTNISILEEKETFVDSDTEISVAGKKEFLQIEEQPKDPLEESILHHSLAANYRLDELTQEEEEKIEQPTVFKPATLEVIAKTEPSSFVGWLHSNNNYTVRDNSDKKAINAVVEDFAEFDPSSDLFGEVQKPKTEFFSPVKKAKISLEENQLPVSETLAKIHVMQGNYPQAISAYQQLILAFPEKKIFFANLIEDLEKKIKTK